MITRLPQIPRYGATVSDFIQNADLPSSDLNYFVTPCDIVVASDALGGTPTGPANTPDKVAYGIGWMLEVRSAADTDFTFSAASGGPGLGNAGGVINAVAQNVSQKFTTQNGVWIRYGYVITLPRPKSSTVYPDILEQPAVVTLASYIAPAPFGGNGGDAAWQPWVKIA